MRFASIGFLLFFLLLPDLSAQDEIRFRLKAPEEAEAGAEFEAVLEARIRDGWKLYSMTLPPGGPIATTIKLVESPVFQREGEVEQPTPKDWFDPNFGFSTEYFEGDVDFKIPVKVDASAQAGEHPLAVAVRFMVCSDSVCLPPQTRELTRKVQVASGGTSTWRTP